MLNLCIPKWTSLLNKGASTDFPNEVDLTVRTSYPTDVHRVQQQLLLYTNNETLKARKFHSTILYIHSVFQTKFQDKINLWYKNLTKVTKF